MSLCFDHFESWNGQTPSNLSLLCWLIPPFLTVDLFSILPMLFFHAVLSSIFPFQHPKYSYTIACGYWACLQEDYYALESEYLISLILIYSSFSEWVGAIFGCTLRYICPILWLWKLYSCWFYNYIFLMILSLITAIVLASLAANHLHDGCRRPPQWLCLMSKITGEVSTVATGGLQSGHRWSAQWPQVICTVALWVFFTSLSCLSDAIASHTAEQITFNKHIPFSPVQTTALVLLMLS